MPEPFSEGAVVGSQFRAEMKFAGHEFPKPMVIEGVSIVGRCQELPDRPQPLFEHVSFARSRDLAQVLERERRASDGEDPQHLVQDRAAPIADLAGGRKKKSSMRAGRSRRS